MSATTNKPYRKPPSSWPLDTGDSYHAIRPIGVGGFGSVWLAKRKDDAKEDDGFVAIKVVGKSKSETMSDFERRSQGGYFHREIAVLSEISHPRIVRLLDSIEDKNNGTTWSPYCMILSYCKGPTVEELINHGGALGIHMAQEISYQLIDAVSYLNGHAVIHRDIKPDNMIITGANLEDDSCWADDSIGEASARARKWQLVLIDFGFARPLHPDEVDPQRHFVDTMKPEPDDGFFGRSTVDADIRDESIHHVDPLSNSLSNSISHNMVRNLSAVGNRNYAAPEVRSKLKKFKDILNSSGGKLFRSKQAPLAECVSDYGMIADAFSVGTTIRHMVTGVPPSIAVDDFLAIKNNPVRLIGKQMKKVFHKKNKGTDKRTKRYRSNDDVPKPAIRLILGLTHWNQIKRTTVREARTYEWVSSSFSAQEEYDKVSQHGQRLKYLKCAYD